MIVVIIITRTTIMETLSMTLTVDDKRLLLLSFFRLLLFIANTNNFTPLYTQLKGNGKSFIFAVFRLP